MSRGKVYLVGAGPGDPGLLTLKGAACLSRADVVVYDFLANPALLAHAAGAEQMYVGKKGSDHTLEQSEINALLVRLGREGRVVVRLKGGDPFVFGRGGEEAEALAEAGVPFEIVPGVTSAVAAPAYAGISLTHRNMTSSVGFITGHEDPTKPESSLDWDRLATGLGTLVFLMGVQRLGHIASSLVAAGRPADTPAALVRWGSAPEQTTVVGTLADIADKAKKAGMTPPAVLVVGEVVSLRDRLNWFETLPLFGRTVLVTRTREQAGALSQALADLGGRVIECPTIRIAPPDDWGPVDRAVDRLADTAWVVLTSPNGVDFLLGRLKERGLDARRFAPVRLAAIGPATAERLAAYGLKADLVPQEYVAEALARDLKAAGVSGRKVLLARAAQARKVLPQALSAAGAIVEEVVLYQTLVPEGLPPEVESLPAEQIPDLVTFTSSSTVTHFIELAKRHGLERLLSVPAACIGPITGRTARQAGLNVAVEAETYTIPDLVAAIQAHFTQG